MPAARVSLLVRSDTGVMPLGAFPVGPDRADSGDVLIPTGDNEVTERRGEHGGVVRGESVHQFLRGEVAAYDRRARALLAGL